MLNIPILGINVKVHYNFLHCYQNCHVSDIKTKTLFIFVELMIPQKQVNALLVQEAKNAST